MKFSVTESANITGGGGSDHASYIRAGVPGFFWGQRGGRAVYRHTWHTQNDTFDAGIPEYQRHSSTIIARCSSLTSKREYRRTSASEINAMSSSMSLYRRSFFKDV